MSSWPSWGDQHINNCLTKLKTLQGNNLLQVFFFLVYIAAKLKDIVGIKI